ncbi:MAG: 2-amino-4-hydroxy-6-hydroxymethyldihydropteridine diphosphokinase [Caldisericia bacterium]|jgi:2-amino-4-hydroxy-6-hydroxymethyldihydropteridine diphosphokinase|nr:2-amino-4-hydroxy-6-hydroxymethyldihydropteridine diphosphokinase [Caldisericia bacterium]
MEIFLSLGSNIEPKEFFLKKAIFYLREKIKIKKISSLYETEPWGYKEQDKFLNIVIQGESEEDPDNLIKFIKNVEKKVGRSENFKWGPREIDIDVILYGDKIIEKENLIVPHKFFEDRGFVVIPLFEINKYIINPKSKRKIDEIYERVDKKGVKKIESEDFFKDIYSEVNINLLDEKDFEIINLESINSTQDYLKENFSLNRLVISKIQTKGRGRKGAYWVSEKGGLFFSFSLKPFNYIYFLPILVTYSMANALKKLIDLNLKIKIPNDLYLNNKKVCGVISEGYFKDIVLQGEIIGVGLNVNQNKRDFPQDLIEKTTSLYIETNKFFFIDEILKLFLYELKRNLVDYENENLNHIIKDLEENFKIFEDPFIVKFNEKEIKVYGEKFIDYKNLKVKDLNGEGHVVSLHNIP